MDFEMVKLEYQRLVYYGIKINDSTCSKIKREGIFKSKYIPTHVCSPYVR